MALLHQRLALGHRILPHQFTLLSGFLVTGTRFQLSDMDTGPGLNICQAFEST